MPDSSYRVHGLCLTLNPSDMLGNSLIFLPQYWDAQERRLIDEILSPGDYVVDVGANIGQYAILFSELVGPEGEVIAIEAERENFLRLSENAHLNNAKNLSLKNYGVSDRKQSLNLLLNSTGNNGGHSFFEQSDAISPPSQRVNCLPLRMLLPKHRRPQFMKLDIEGFEFRVLGDFFSRVEARWWPQYLMLEDNEARREDDAVDLCIENGYDQIERFGSNVFLTHSLCEGANFR